MKITIEDIDKALSIIESSDEDIIEELLSKMDKEIPDAVDYIHEAEEDDLNSEERNLLIDTSVFAWHIVKETLNKKISISPADIDFQLEHNIVLFETDEDVEESEDDLEALFTDSNNEKDLIMYLVNLIIEEADSENEIREDMIFTIILHLKTFIDCIVKD